MERHSLLLLATLAMGLLAASVPNTVAAQSQLPTGFRLPDDRPPLDTAALNAAGLTLLKSRHLLLVTDAPAEDVYGLPDLADEFFAALCKTLPPLKPAADGSEFQVTGFLMEAPERFQQAGLLPDEKFVIRHGRHLGYRFWMRNQPSAYYRRHLLLHEFVHCWMMCEAGMRRHSATLVHRRACRIPRNSLRHHLRSSTLRHPPGITDRLRRLGPHHADPGTGLRSYRISG
ncbi:MAG UNVERIFIED_CONTAM: hypothetical protein LVR18_04465 [Planctomycetaceae bacterium]|jgi:hypothetical protein